MSGEPQKILGKAGSGWAKFPEQKNGKEKGKKIRFYLLDRHNVKKAKETLLEFRNSALERSIHGLGEDITKTPYLIRRGYALYCTSTFPVLRDYPEEEIEKEEDEAELERDQKNVHLKSPVSKEESKAESKQKPLSKSRFGSVDLLPKNESFDEKGFNEYKRLFFDEYKDNPFRPVLTENGRINWKSDSAVSGNDVFQVIRYTRKNGRSLLINTGTHGDPQGNTVVQDVALAESDFAKEDLDSVWDENKAAVQMNTLSMKVAHRVNLFSA